MSAPDWWWSAESYNKTCQSQWPQPDCNRGTQCFTWLVLIDFPHCMSVCTLTHSPIINHSNLTLTNASALKFDDWHYEALSVHIRKPTSHWTFSLSWCLLVTTHKAHHAMTVSPKIGNTLWWLQSCAADEDAVPKWIQWVIIVVFIGLLVWLIYSSDWWNASCDRHSVSVWYTHDHYKQSKKTNTFLHLVVSKLLWSSAIKQLSHV